MPKLERARPKITPLFVTLLPEPEAARYPQLDKYDAV
jgi:hypothetical protein